jgi:hypothetical protein
MKDFKALTAGQIHLILISIKARVETLIKDLNHALMSAKVLTEIDKKEGQE